MPLYDRKHSKRSAMNQTVIISLWRLCHSVHRWRERMPHLPIQAPVYCRIVHFVDEDYQVFDSSCFRQHSVLTGLTALFKARLKLTLSGRDNLARREEKRKEYIAYKTTLKNFCKKKKKNPTDTPKIWMTVIKNAKLTDKSILCCKKVSNLTVPDILLKEDKDRRYSTN